LQAIPRRPSGMFGQYPSHPRVWFLMQVETGPRGRRRGCSERWVATARVGGVGAEVRVSMRPEESAGQLLKHAEAEKGVAGAVFAM
jgi:hypothetical protein